MKFIFESAVVARYRVFTISCQQNALIGYNLYFLLLVSFKLTICSYNSYERQQ